MREGFFEQPTREEGEIASRHAAYVKQLVDEGVSLIAGPCFDPTGVPTGEKAVPLAMPAAGIVIFKAKNREKAQTIMDNDPAIQNGVFKGLLAPFHPAFFNLDAF